MHSWLKISVGTSLAFLTIGLLSERVFSRRVARHPYLGIVFKPGELVRYRLEGDGLSQWTDHGIRRPVFPGVNDRPRILVLGDSMVEALQVDDKDVFTALVEKNLSTLVPSVAVLNAGRGGRSVADHIALSPIFRSILKPDWVVAVVMASDFLGESWGKTGNRFEFVGGGSELTIVSAPVVVRPGKIGEAILWLNNTCGLAQFTSFRLKEFRGWVQQEPPWFYAKKTVADPQPDQDSEAGRYPIAEELDLLVRAYEGRLTLVLLERYPLGTSGEARLVDSKLKQHAAERGLSFVALSEGFGAFANFRNAPYGFSNSRFNQGHLNPDGHRVLADLLSAELRRVIAKNGFH